MAPDGLNARAPAPVDARDEPAGGLSWPHGDGYDPMHGTRAAKLIITPEIAAAVDSLKPGQYLEVPY